MYRLTAFIVTCAGATPEPTALDDKRISEINAKDLGWRASRNARFEGVSLAAFRSMLGVKEDESTDCPPPTNQTANVPDSFDARTQWPEYIHAIRDQGQCGSCWAFAASEVLSDRLAIASKGSYNLVLSPEALIKCDDREMGCSGGYPWKAHDFLVSSGIPSDKCEPYFLGGDSANGCPARCIDGSYRDVYKYESWHYATGEEAMKAALQTGPVAIGMRVLSGFQEYKSGVYKCDNSDFEGLHAVKLLGYGTTGPNDSPARAPYWIVANSWGSSWGENGTFRIRRGKDDCGIEKGAGTGTSPSSCPIAGVPSIPSPSPVPPPPAPAKTHYGQPPCKQDEVLTYHRGGSMCTPANCKSTSNCPTDVPEGTKASPTCTNEFNKSAPSVCALHCREPLPGIGNGGCPSTMACEQGSPFKGDYCVFEQMVIV